MWKRMLPDRGSGKENINSKDNLMLDELLNVKYVSGTVEITKYSDRNEMD